MLIFTCSPDCLMNNRLLKGPGTSGESKINTSQGKLNICLNSLDLYVTQKWQQKVKITYTLSVQTSCCMSKGETPTSSLQ